MLYLKNIFFSYVNMSLRYYIINIISIVNVIIMYITWSVNNWEN